MLPDIQDESDSRGIEVDRVGVAGVRYPISFHDGAVTQSGVAMVDMTVTLPAARRGTHMSRMVELVHDHLRDLDPRELPTILKAAANKLDVDGVQLAIALPMAFPVASPASGLESWQACDVVVEGELVEGASAVTTSVTSDVTSLCPCSKAISDYGAHNQRSTVTLAVIGIGDAPYPLAVEAAFTMIRKVGSSPVYPLVKRADERVLTMDAHDHPAFVEDMARDLSAACRRLGLAHEVRIRNIESIHSHDAVSSVGWRV